MDEHPRDARTGRPLDEVGYAIETLTDAELQEELTVAAVAPDHLRLDRFETLLQELQSRLLAYRGWPSAPAAP